MPVRGLRHLLEAYLAIGTFDAKYAAFEFHVSFRRFQHPGTETLAFLHHLIGREFECGASGAHAALSEGSSAVQRTLGIALFNPYVFERHAEPLARICANIVS